MTASAKVVAGVRLARANIAQAILAVTHNGFALLGLLVAFIALTLVARDDLRHSGENYLRSWLEARHLTSAQPADVGATNAAAATSDVNPIIAAVDRATATNPRQLPKNQAAVAYWLSKKYSVAPEPLAALVSQAYEVGKAAKLDPTLILAIMAVESSFNPFAQSSVGAQGLMQVMTKIHTDKYEGFGGHFAAFDPVTNLKVGVQVLQECIQRAGSIEGGLRYYVGAANLPSDSGYAAKVMAEHFRIKQVANGRSNPATLPAKSDLSAKASTPATRPADTANTTADVALADTSATNAASVSNTMRTKVTLVAGS